MMSIFGISFCYTIKNMLAGEETFTAIFKKDFCTDFVFYI